MRHPAKNDNSVNASRSDSMCADADTDTANRIATVHVASAHETHDQFTVVMLIHGFSPQVSRGRALKSFRMLLDRRRPLVHHPAVVHYYVFCVFSKILP